MDPRLNKLISIAVLAAVSACLVALSGCAALEDGELFPRVIQPSITPKFGEDGQNHADRDFAFQGGRVRFSLPIDAAVYKGAKQAKKSAIFFGDEPADWVPAYYRAFVDEKHQEPFYESLRETLHEVRDREGLDDSEYVELVAAMAQQIEYRVDPVNLAPKFPIETFGDGFGDCDDKTLLAAALLARDGYDVAVLLFEPEKHIALGVKAPGLDYKGTGYAFAEMSQPALVGQPTVELSTGEKLTSQPQVIRIGDGTRAFGAGDQSAYIVSRLKRVRDKQDELRASIDKRTAELKALQNQLQAEGDAIDAMTDPVAAQAAVADYNRKVEAANRSADTVNRTVARYNALVEAETFAIENPTDRPAVYQKLRGVDL